MIRHHVLSGHDYKVWRLKPDLVLFKPWMKPGRFLSWFSEELCDLEESRLEAPMATFVTRGPTNTYLPQVSMWPHHDVTPRPGIKRYVGRKL